MNPWDFGSPCGMYRRSHSLCKLRALVSRRRLIRPAQHTASQPSLRQGRAGPFSKCSYFPPTAIRLGEARGASGVSKSSVLHGRTQLRLWTQVRLRRSFRIYSPFLFTRSTRGDLETKLRVQLLENVTSVSTAKVGRRLHAPDLYLITKGCTEWQDPTQLAP